MKRNEFLKFLKKLITPLQNIHAKGIVNNDIKPDNIMIKGTKLADGEVSYIDFGVSAHENSNVG